MPKIQNAHQSRAVVAITSRCDIVGLDPTPLASLPLALRRMVHHQCRRHANVVANCHTCTVNSAPLCDRVCHATIMLHSRSQATSNTCPESYYFAPCDEATSPMSLASLFAGTKCRGSGAPAPPLAGDGGQRLHHHHARRCPSHCHDACRPWLAPQGHHGLLAQVHAPRAQYHQIAPAAAQLQ